MFQNQKWLSHSLSHSRSDKVAYWAVRLSSEQLKIWKKSKKIQQESKKYQEEIEKNQEEIQIFLERNT